MSRFQTVVIVTGALVAINMLTTWHRSQSHSLDRLSSDSQTRTSLQAQVTQLERDLAQARLSLSVAQHTGATGPQLILSGSQQQHAADAQYPGWDTPESTAQQRNSSEAAVNQPPHERGWYERVEDIPKDATVWVTFVNGDEAYQELMLNWAFHLRRLHVPHIVIAFDDVAAENCRAEGIPHIRNLETFISGDFRQDFGTFRRMGSNKPRIVLELLEKHGLATVVLSDVDTVWLRHPAEFVTRHPTADVLISTDCLSHWVEAAYDPDRPTLSHYHRCGHLPNSGFGRAFNTGTIIFRNRDATLDVLREWRALLTDPDRAYTKTTSHKDLAITDQLAFNIILERDSVPIRSTAEDWRVIWAAGNKLRLMPLPVLLFTNGHVFFYQHLPQQHQVQAYVVHCTFQRHHTAGKRLRLREEGLWLVERPGYYSEGNFMTYENDVARYVDALSSAAAMPLPDLFKHFHAMSYQLAAMRDAFAIAHTLNRTLVLPRFICYCDQDWYASILPRCRVDSSDLVPPFVCPLDILLNPGRLDSSPLPYRVASFFTSSETPAQVTNSRETAAIDSNSDWVELMRKHNVGAGEHLRAGEPADVIRERLARLSPVRVLSFTGLRPGAFGGFGSREGDAWLDSTMRTVLSTDSRWCCSGEQPIAVEWITWNYIQPVPLSSGVPPDWSIPKYELPPHCRDIMEEKAGALNARFAQEENHPCNFLARDFQLPAALQSVLPSTAKLAIA